MKNILLLATAILLNLQFINAQPFFRADELGLEMNVEKIQSKKLQSIIDSLSESGGGTLIFPAGEITTGSIELQPKVSYYLASGFTWNASADIYDYKIFNQNEVLELKESNQEDGRIIFLHGINLENISISGPGKIYGNGNYFYDKDYKPLLRPTPWILFENSENIVLRDFKIENSPSHCIRIENSRFFTITGISVQNPMQSPNTDGLNIVDSKDIFISQCYFSTGDDAICLKSHNAFVENIIVSDCIIESDDAAIKFGTGSKVGIRFCRFENNIIRNTRYGIALFMLDGGIFNNNDFVNTTIETSSRHKIEYPIFVDIDKRKENSEIGRIDHLRFLNISIVTRGKVLISGHPQAKIQNLELNNLEIVVKEDADFAKLSKPRGNKNYPKLQESLDNASHPSYLTLSFIENLYTKSYKIINPFNDRKHVFYSNVKFMNNSNIMNSHNSGD